MYDRKHIASFNDVMHNFRETLQVEVGKITSSNMLVWITGSCCTPQSYIWKHYTARKGCQTYGQLLFLFWIYITLCIMHGVM